MILQDEKINYYTVAKQAEVSRAYLYNHNAFSMMIETFSNLQKENESEDSLYEKFEQAEKRYVELQLEYEKVKAKYDVWRDENDKSKKKLLRECHIICVNCPGCNSDFIELSKSCKG